MYAWMRGSALALVAALAFAPGHAGAETPDGETVSWPLPWKDGLTLVYDDSYSKTSQRDGASYSVGTTSRSHIATTRTADGFRQRWWTRDAKVDADGMGPASAIVRASMESLADLELEILLDAEGAYSAVGNLDALVPRMRAALDRTMDAAFAAANMPPESNEVKAAKAAVINQLTAPAVLEVSLAETPHVYNSLAGGGIPPGETSFEDEGLMPIGGEGMVKRTNTLTVVAAPDAPGHWDVRWRVQPDSAQIRAKLVAAAEQIMAEMKHPADKVVAQIGDVDFGSVVDYRIDGATGIVERVKRVTRKQFSGRVEIETHEMTRVRE